MQTLTYLHGLRPRENFYVHVRGKEIGFGNPALSFIQQKMAVAKGACWIKEGSLYLNE